MEEMTLGLPCLLYKCLDLRWILMPTSSMYYESVVIVLYDESESEVRIIHASSQGSLPGIDSSQPDTLSEKDEGKNHPSMFCSDLHPCVKAPVYIMLLHSCTHSEMHTHTAYV